MKSTPTVVEAVKEVNHRDVIIRTAKTFVAAFIGVFVLSFANLFDIVSKQGLSGLKSATAALLGSAIAAGITAIWNYYLQAKAIRSDGGL